MGRQINYYMDFDNFLVVAQAALDEGCLIVSRTHTPTPPVPGAGLSAITSDESMYYFYLPELAPLEHGIDNFGNYYVKSFATQCGLALIAAGYSRRPAANSTESASPARLYMPTGFYLDGVWVPRHERTEHVYNRLVRVVKRVAPYTPLTLGEGNTTRTCKAYISPECLRWREDAANQSPSPR